MEKITLRSKGKKRMKHFDGFLSYLKFIKYSLTLIPTSQCPLRMPKSVNTFA